MAGLNAFLSIGGGTTIFGTKLFRCSNAHMRGTMLESVLNRFFKVSGMLVREAFTLTGPDNSGIVEQIDGAVEIDGTLYLVEMK